MLITVIFTALLFHYGNMDFSFIDGYAEKLLNLYMEICSILLVCTGLFVAYLGFYRKNGEALSGWFSIGKDKANNCFIKKIVLINEKDKPIFILKISMFSTYYMKKIDLIDFYNNPKRLEPLSIISLSVRPGILHYLDFENHIFNEEHQYIKFECFTTMNTTIQVKLQRDNSFNME